ncbi:helix-turn-helix domain-containing protein [Serratia ureilytica]
MEAEKQNPHGDEAVAGRKAVKYVASTLGYNDPSAFIAMFRRQTGQSPSGF